MFFDVPRPWVEGEFDGVGVREGTDERDASKNDRVELGGDMRKGDTICSYREGEGKEFADGIGN